MSGRRRVAVRSLFLGLAFGFVLVRSEAISWYRIQEMFRLQSFHMYGIIGSAVLVGMVSLWIIRRHEIRGPDGEALEIAPKETGGRNTRYWAGGAVFGLGWGILGACPGPIYALIGSGHTVFFVALGSAVCGTWLYGALRDRLPHY